MGAAETLAVLRRYADGWAAGEPDLFDNYADDATFHYFGATDLAGSHRGEDACLTALITASARAPRTLLEVVDVLAGERSGALVVRELLRRDGEEHELVRTLRFRVADDRIVECWLLDEDQALVDRLWRP